MSTKTTDITKFSSAGVIYFEECDEPMRGKGIFYLFWGLWQINAGKTYFLFIFGVVTNQCGNVYFLFKWFPHFHPNAAGTLFNLL